MFDTGLDAFTTENDYQDPSPQRCPGRDRHVVID